MIEKKVLRSNIITYEVSWQSFKNFLRSPLKFQARSLQLYLK